MLKKTLLKNTHEFLEKSFPENFFSKKKVNKKREKVIVSKAIILKKKLFQFKRKNLILLQKKNSASEKFPFKTENTNIVFSNKKHNDFLFSMHMIKSEFEKKQNKNSDFKNKLKEKKKLSILYGNLSNKQIQKTLQQADKLQGNTGDNLVILLESRLDVILYRALFFSSIKFARQWIKYGRILLNSFPINTYSYKVKFGDIISIQKKHKKFVGKNILKFFFKYHLYTNTRCFFALPTNLRLVDNGEMVSNKAEKPFLLKLTKKNFNVEKKIIFNLLVADEMKLNINTPLSLYKYMFFSNKTKLRKNQNYSNFIRENNFILNSSTLHEKLLNLKNKSQSVINKSILHTKNFFVNKQRYTISNFDFTLIQNQFKPINKLLFKKNIQTLNEVFKINTFISCTKKYQIFTKTKSVLIKTGNNLVSSLKTKKNFLLRENKGNTKFKILLSILNKAVLKQITQIVSFKFNNNFGCKIEKKWYTNTLIQLNLVKHCDILFFLKLKNLFFKKREVFSFKNLSRKTYFKPLNLEISYKTLNIIHLFPSQKIVFPCSLDVDLLY